MVLDLKIDDFGVVKDNAESVTRDTETVESAERFLEEEVLETGHSKPLSDKLMYDLPFDTGTADDEVPEPSSTPVTPTGNTEIETHSCTGNKLAGRSVDICDISNKLGAVEVLHEATDSGEQALTTMPCYKEHREDSGDEDMYVKNGIHVMDLRTRAGFATPPKPQILSKTIDGSLYRRKNVIGSVSAEARDPEEKLTLSHSTMSEPAIEEHITHASPFEVKPLSATPSHSPDAKAFALVDDIEATSSALLNTPVEIQDSSEKPGGTDVASSGNIQVPDLLSNPDPLGYVLETMSQIARDLEELSPTQRHIKKIRARKALVKSPYFATPPVTPSKKADSKTGKSTDFVYCEGIPASNSQPTTPQKEIDNLSFPLSAKKPRTPGKTISCIPFPPLGNTHFGLIQEKLAHDPFRLLIAVTFLIRTHGKHAIPIFFQLISQYPTPDSLVSAKKEDIVAIIQHLGLQNQRAATYQMYAKIWLENPPIKGKRYLVRGYPKPDSGRNVKRGEVISDCDEREAWEIGHMTSGPYALDSWRIFCRDELRGLAKDWNGTGAEQGFQPEWMRVLPLDKELRAYLRWMWLKEGFEWDPFTGEKEVASNDLMKAAIEGRIAWDDNGGLRVLDHKPDPSEMQAKNSEE